MDLNYIIPIVIVLTTIIISYFIQKSNKHLKKEYKNNKPIFLGGMIVNKKHYTQKGWRYRQISFLVLFLGFVLFLFFSIVL